VRGLVVGGSHDERREEASEPAARADDSGDCADPLGWCQSSDPGENATRAQSEEESHQDECRSSWQLGRQSECDDQRQHRCPGEGNGDNLTRTDLVGENAADWSCDYRCDRKPCGSSASTGQAKAIDVFDIRRQVGRECHETAEGDGIQEGHLPGERQLGGSRKLRYDGCEIGLPGR
jgi:hypothetical protein